VPLSLLILVLIIILVNALLTSTKFGRHLMATGGNPESARRVGIPVLRITVIGFAMTGALAAFGGVMAASRLGAATQAAGGSDTLLLAIAAPVIAGVSLFGGRGSVWAALMGSIVIGAISNGMDLLGLDQSYKYILTGIVLALAVALDAMARMRRRSKGSTS
jgi:D-xylose transport system permease protein